jgi:hypothetical protein
MGGMTGAVTAITTEATTAAGITEGAADNGLAGPSGQPLKHLVRDEPVPFRET